MKEAAGQRPGHEAAVIAALVDARLGDRPPLIDELDGNIKDALQTQLGVLEALERSGRTISGWKVGLTSGASHDLLGVGVRPFGYILSERTLQSGSVLGAGLDLGIQIEPEICLTMKTDLQGCDVTAEQCRAAVASARGAFEINLGRVTMPGRNNLFVADGLANWGLVVGPAAEPRDNLAQARVNLFLDDRPLAQSGADLVMDDPFLSLARLCHQLGNFGMGLKAGQHVITGAFLRWGVKQSGTYTANFEDWGQVSLTIG